MNKRSALKRAKKRVKVKYTSSFSNSSKKKRKELTVIVVEVPGDVPAAAESQRRQRVEHQEDLRHTVAREGDLFFFGEEERTSERQQS